MADQLTPARGKVDRAGVAVGYRVVGAGPPPPMQRWAAAAGIDYFSVAGDHGGAPFTSAGTVLGRTLQFLSDAEVKGEM